MKIVLLGSIGSGKSTTCKIIARDKNIRVFEENFEENPFIKLYYDKECKKYEKSENIFQLQMWFLSEYKRRSEETKLYNDYILDAGATAGLAFCVTQTNLKQMSNIEFDLYMDLWKSIFLVDGKLDKEAKYIIIDRDLSDLMAKIAKRGREHEKSIKEFFVKELKYSYLKLPEILKSFGFDCEVLKVSLSESREQVARRVMKLHDEMMNNE